MKNIKNKLKKAWILTIMLFMMWTTFFALFIPAMFGIFYFILFTGMVQTTDIWSLLFILVIMIFGALFICMTITYKVTFMYVDIYGWDDKFEKLNKEDKK